MDYSHQTAFNGTLKFRIIATHMNLMTLHQYPVNERHLSCFSALPQELIYEPTKNYLFDLSYLTGLQIAGDNAATFLQGQLSCDVREVHYHQMRQGALCNLKGRILALVDVVQWEHHGFQLILPDDLLSLTETSLTKTAMLSRISLQQATNYELLGFYLQNPNDVIPFDLKLTNTPYQLMSQAKFCCYSLGNHRYMILIDQEEASSLRNTFINASQWRGGLAWHALQLENKQIEIYPNSRGLFLPHRLDLHQTSHLSFNKGCYKGQEIIARTHYRATLKHELKRFTIQTNESIRSGQLLFDPTGKINIGELIDYCPIEEGKYLIAASVLFEHPEHAYFEGHDRLVSLTPI